MPRYLFLLACLVGFQYSWATTFVPVSIKKQIKESDGFVYGEVLAVESEMENEVIHSKVTLRANKWMGLTPEEDLIEVYFPGGKVGDQVFQVHGSPKFEIGEGVVLLTKQHKNKMWVNNLGLGKYSAKKIGEKTLIINQIFPGHPAIGQIALKNFYELAEWVKKDKFQERFKDKYEINYEHQLKIKKRRRAPSRAIASDNSNINSEEHHSNEPYWLVLVLAAMGVAMGILRNRA